MKQKTIHMLVFVIAGALGFAIGYGVGFVSGMSFLIDKGVTMLQNAGVNITLTGDQIAQLIDVYKERFLHGGASSLSGVQILK